MTRKLGMWLGASALLAITTSCGKDICVLGQGDCSQELTTTSLILTASAATMTTSSMPGQEAPRCSGDMAYRTRCSTVAVCAVAAGFGFLALVTWNLLLRLTWAA